MVSRKLEDAWPDFTATAWFQFLSLPPMAIQSFAAVFPELAQSPQRPSATLDVCPIRNDPKRWRLKVGRYRAIYRVYHGWPVVEQILPRTERTYRSL